METGSSLTVVFFFLSVCRVGKEEEETHNKKKSRKIHVKMELVRGITNKYARMKKRKEKCVCVVFLFSVIGAASMYRKMGTKPGLPVARVRMVNVSFLLDVL